MANYAGRGAPPRTLTTTEQAAILRVSGEHRDGFRDHVLFALALGSGLREHEIAALDVADVSNDGRAVKRRIVLRVFKGSGRKGRKKQPQVVILSDAAVWKLSRYLAGEPRRAGPLFRSNRGTRIATRTIRERFQTWQKRAGVERPVRFHDLRHTYCTNVYVGSGRDLAQVQRLGRHARIETSMVYTHVSETELERTARAVPS